MRSRNFSSRPPPSTATWQTGYAAPPTPTPRTAKSSCTASAGTPPQTPLPARSPPTATSRTARPSWTRPLASPRATASSSSRPVALRATRSASRRKGSATALPHASWRPWAQSSRRRRRFRRRRGLRISRRGRSM